MATKAQIDSFISTIGPMIKAEATKRGYKICSTIIAQACIESAFGVSVLGKKYHNYFGMKCGSSWKGKSVNLSTKEEYKAGEMTSIMANFRAYDSMEEGVAGYFDFISAKRYSNLKTATTYRDFATLLKADGYATSSTYISTLVNTVDKYGLAKYDDVVTMPKNSVDVSKFPLLRKGSSGPYVATLQQSLNYRGVMGGKLSTDGLFGTVTYNAVIEFQALKGLTKDGVVGQKTWAALMND